MHRTKCGGHFVLEEWKKNWSLRSVEISSPRAQRRSRLIARPRERERPDTSYSLSLFRSVPVGSVHSFVRSPLCLTQCQAFDGMSRAASFSLFWLLWLLWLNVVAYYYKVGVVACDADKRRRSLLLLLLRRERERERLSFLQLRSRN